VLTEVGDVRRIGTDGVLGTAPLGPQVTDEVLDQPAVASLAGVQLANA
jgi:hypothetical protein